MSCVESALTAARVFAKRSRCAVCWVEGSAVLGLHILPVYRVPLREAK